MSDNGVLSTIVNFIPSDHMATDNIFRPADAKSLEYGLQLILITVLSFRPIPFVISG